MEERVTSVREFIAPELTPESYELLSGGALIAVAFWRKRNPDLYRELVHRGLLVERANEAARQVDEKMRVLHSQGLNSEEAWNQASREWFYRVPGLTEP